MFLINLSSFLYADNSTMTCRACHEECNDTCSSPVSITFKILYDVLISVYNRNPLTVLVDAKTLLFLLLIIQSPVFHNVQ